MIFNSVPQPQPMMPHAQPPLNMNLPNPPQKLPHPIMNSGPQKLSSLHQQQPQPQQQPQQLASNIPGEYPAQS